MVSQFAPGLLKGKAALVTGSTSGIGLAMLKALAGAGCDVAMNGLGEASALQKLTEQVASDNGVKVHLRQCDLRKGAEIRDMVKATADGFGRCGGAGHDMRQCYPRRSAVPESSALPRVTALHEAGCYSCDREPGKDAEQCRHFPTLHVGRVPTMLTS